MMICLLVVAMCLGCVGANSNSSDTFFDESAFFSTQNSSITFFSHADWGKGGYDGSQYRRERNLEEKNDEKESNGGEHREETFYQGYTARTMLQVAAMSKPSFVLALGDNFYDDGVNSTTDSMWNTHFRDVYFRSDELRGIPWYSALGNHDLGYGDTGVQAQIDRSTASTADDDGVWSTNGQWYTIQHDIPGGGSVVVVMVDTTWLAPSENEATNEEGGISLDTQASRIGQQIKGLIEIFENIAKNQPTWLLVGGHYPMYSYGEKGDNEELKDYLRPLLEGYGVHAYLCGHDHIAEHLKYRGVDYIVTGHSSMNGVVQENSNSTLVWAGESTSGFTRWTATRHALVVEFVEANTSQVLYSHIFTEPLSLMPSYDYEADDDYVEVYLPPFMRSQWAMKYFMSISEMYGLKKGETLFIGSAFAFFCAFGVASSLIILTRLFMQPRKGRSIVDRLGMPLRRTAIEGLDLHYRKPHEDTLYYESVQSQYNAASLVSPKVSLFEQIMGLATTGRQYRHYHDHHHQGQQSLQGSGYESVSLAASGSRSDLTYDNFAFSLDHMHPDSKQNSLYTGTRYNLENGASPRSDTSSDWATNSQSFANSITDIAHSVHNSIYSLRTAPTHFRALRADAEDIPGRPRRHSIS